LNSFRPFQENNYPKVEKFPMEKVLDLGYFKSWNYLIRFVKPEEIAMNKKLILASILLLVLLPLEIAYAAAYDYVFVSQNLPPSTMLPGEQYTFYFKVRNTGTETWGRSIVKLGTEGPKDRASTFYQSGAYGWESANRIRLKESSVAPNGIATFEATVTAPSTTGYYFERFRVVADGIGWIETGPELSFQVTVEEPTYEYEFYSQDLPPATMIPGEQYTFDFKVRNTGTATWSQSVVRLGTEGPKDRDSAFYQAGAYGWESANRIRLKENSVTPNGIATFEATVTAPQTSGDYFERFRVVADGVGWLETSPELSFQVTVEEPTYEYEFYSQNLPPATMIPGEQYTFDFKVRNTGTATWSQSVVRLGTEGPRDRDSAFYQAGAYGWESANRIRLKESSVAPNGIATFEATITAPQTSGDYFERFRVVTDGVGWLETSPELSFQVIVEGLDSYNYEFVSQDLPPTQMVPGEQYTFHFQVRNTGSTIWTNDIVKLGTENPRDRNSIFYQ
jgi:Tfp pilus assembly protein PilX